eukprot:2928427-Pleurochrysis_carterae.AAC.1
MARRRMQASSPHTSHSDASKAKDEESILGAVGARGSGCAWQWVHVAVGARGCGCAWLWLRVAVGARGCGCAWQWVR